MWNVPAATRRQPCGGASTRAPRPSRIRGSTGAAPPRVSLASRARPARHGVDGERKKRRVVAESRANMEPHREIRRPLPQRRGEAVQRRVFEDVMNRPHADDVEPPHGGQIAEAGEGIARRAAGAPKVLAGKETGVAGGGGARWGV